jgi:hypothetical protein
VTFTNFGQGTFDQGFKVKRESGDWEVEVEANDGLEVLVRSFFYEPGAQTGWHRHPGPVFIQVIEGTVTFFEADDPNCEPIVVHAGEGYLDTGEHGHIGRNLSGANAKDLVVFFAPPGTQISGLRLDMDDPGNCPF